jgi:hypothetical protein
MVDKTNLNSTEVDVSVINVLRIVNRFDDDCTLTILNLPENSSVANGYFMVNITLNLSDYECDTVYISVFDQVYGSLDNITVTGTISLSDVQPTTNKLVLSRMYGNVNQNTTYMTDLNNKSIILSNLKFTIMGNELINQTQTINNVQFQSLLVTN